MGGYVSCMVKPSKPTKATLFGTQGQVRRLELPILAAEIMLEEPGTVVCALQDILRGRCLWALRADEQLLAGKLYLMVPSEKVYRKVSEFELGVIESACKKRGRKVGPKVFPSIEGEKEEEEVGLSKTGVLGHKLGSSKQWRPMLEPIHEVF